MTMEMFVWWEVPLSMKAEWSCALTTSGELCVMTTGTTLMPQWSANSWDILEVCTTNNLIKLAFSMNTHHVMFEVIEAKTALS